MTKKNRRNRATGGKLAPVLKAKKRPRGKPFPKGNTIGFASRFRKGAPSPNPGGRPKSQKQSEANRTLLASVVPEDELRKHKIPRRLWGQTYAEINAWVLEQEALSGKIGAISELADRAEGRPSLAVQLSETGDPLVSLVEEMKKRSKELGPPEGHVSIQSDDERVEEAITQ